MTGALNRLMIWKHVPAPGYFILGTEFCERFTYYGMTAILPLFLTGYLAFSQSSSVQIMSGVSFASYLFAFVGAILGDSYIGKYATIGSFSSLYAIGTILLAVSAIPGVTGIPPHWWMAGLALLVITIGTGGIKPCVSAFGGEQISNPDSRAVFFSYFYLMVNIGSFISMFVTPLIKSNPCFGRSDCFTGAFSLPAGLMIVAVIVFLSGKKLYKPGPPRNTIMIDFVCAVSLAASRKVKSIFVKRTEPRPANWIQYAKPKYSDEMLEHCRAMLNVFLTFLPLCLYWGLYSQMSSRWIFQATMMNESLGGSLKIMPEQMGILNCILVIIFVPLFDALLYPAVKKITRKPFSPFARIVSSMILGSISFVIAACVQIFMEKRGTFEPDPLNPLTLKCVDGCVSILWQIPQYIILTASEVLLSVAQLGLVYSMAPKELKSVCSALSMLTNAAGNLLVIGFAKVDPISWFAKSDTGRSSAVGNFFMWSVLCLIGTAWFCLSTRGLDVQEKEEAEIEMEAVKVVKDDSDAEEPSPETQKDTFINDEASTSTDELIKS